MNVRIFGHISKMKFGHIREEKIMSALEYRHERYVAMVGYAFGHRTGNSEWQTCLGSHWETYPLFDTPEKAQTWFNKRFPNWSLAESQDASEYAVRKIERVSQEYFRVVE